MFTLIKRGGFAAWFRGSFLFGETRITAFRVIFPPVAGGRKDKIYLINNDVRNYLWSPDFSPVEPYNITTIVRGLDYEKKNTSRIHQ